MLTINGDMIYRDGLCLGRGRNGAHAANKKSRICTIMKTDREIIQDLAGGFTVRDEIDGWDSELFMQPPGRYSVTHNQIQSLIDGGWLRTFPNGSGYRLSDEGLKAHNRAMDELGDGKLIAPNTSNLPQTTTDKIQIR